MQPKRRWLKSALAAASSEAPALPWTAKRIMRPAPDAPQSAPIIRIYPSMPAKFGAIAAC
jgi:hypothetical protein